MPRESRWGPNPKARTPHDSSTITSQHHPTDAANDTDVADKPRMKFLPIPDELDAERFWKLVERTPDGCWEWKGRVKLDGYGQFAHGGKTYAAHRVAWTLTNGPIPDGLVTDHLCRNTRCVRPEHLEVVTVRENVARGNGAAAKHVRAWLFGFCQRGHDLAVLGTHKSGPSRICAECNRQRQAAYRKRCSS